MSIIKLDLKKMDEFLKTFSGMSPTEFLTCSIFVQCTIPEVRYNVTRMYGSPTVFKENLALMETAGIVELTRVLPDLTQQLKYVKFTPTAQKLFLETSGKMDTFVEDFRELFPVNYKGDNRGCRIKLVNFIKEYDEYSKEDILEATKNYINSFNGSYNYLQQAHYFVMKNQISNLASWCEKLSQEDGTNTGSTVERLNREDV